MQGEREQTGLTKGEETRKPSGGEHSGHRRRLIAKLESHSLCEHEYLELLLFNAIPRRNTNEIAHRLLSEFGSIPNVLSAPMEQLKRVDGVGENVAAYLRCLGLIFENVKKEETSVFPHRFDYESFVSYMKSEYPKIPFEVLDIYVLDDLGNILGRQRFSSEMFGKVEIQAQWLSRFFLEQAPTGIVMVHNHPSGEARPSEKDDVTTRQCQSLCRDNGVIFCDHFIFSGRGVYSYNLNGKLGGEREKTELPFGRGIGGRNG